MNLNKKMKKKHVIIITLLVVEVISLVLTYKSFNNKVVELGTSSESENKNFSMYMQDENGEYYLSKKNYFPSDTSYKLNETLSECLDVRGDRINVNIVYANGKMTVSSSKTVYCTFYFDLIKKLYDELVRSGLALEYRGEGYYHSDNDRDTTNPFFTAPVYYWNGSIAKNQEEIIDKWNVVFAGNCWQMIRTTDNGGVKLFYNGLPDITIDSDTGIKSYDCSDNRVVYSAGYNRTTINLGGNYYYSTGYTYNKNSGLYTMVGVESNTRYYYNSSASNFIGKFTCASAATSCSTLYYIDAKYGDSGSTAYVIEMTTIPSREGMGSTSNSASYFGYMYPFETSLYTSGSDGQGSYVSETQLLTNSSSVYVLDYDYINLSSSTYYFSNTISSGNLVDSQTQATIKNNSVNDDYSDLLGMYISRYNNGGVSGYVTGIVGNLLKYVRSDYLDTRPTYYSITPANDQIKVQSRAGAGVTVPVVSNVSGYKVYSFRVNGTEVVGDSFVMPNANVTITDVKFYTPIILSEEDVETSHYPFKCLGREQIPSTNTSLVCGKTYYNKTIEGANEIEVQMNYGIGYNAMIYLYSSPSEYREIYSSGEETFHIKGNYVKILLGTSRNISSDYYGFKAHIIAYGVGEPVSLQVSGDGSGSLANSVLVDGKNFTIGSSITDNGDGTYTINNPIKINWVEDIYGNGINRVNTNREYNNYYACNNLNSTTCSYGSMKLMTSFSSISYSAIYSSTSKIKLSTSYTINGNLAYLDNPIEVKTIDLSSTNFYESIYDGHTPDEYNYYQDTYVNYFYCPNNPELTSCSTMAKIYQVSANPRYGTLYVYYKKALTYSDEFQYTNGQYILNLNSPNVTGMDGFETEAELQSILNAHYTCLNTVGRCQTAKYLYYIGGSSGAQIGELKFNYVELSNGRYVNTNESDVNFKNSNNYLYRILYGNTYSSNRKENIESWYKLNLSNTAYESIIDDEEVYCDDRRTSNNFGSFSNTAYNMSEMMLFKQSFPNSNIACPEKTFAYSASETTYGNGELTYPVGPLSASESYILTGNSAPSILREASAMYLTGSILSYTSGLSHYDGLYSRITSDGSISINPAVNMPRINVYLRPSLALKSGVEYSRGTGSASDPFVVEVGHEISLSNNDFTTNVLKASAGETIKIFGKTNVYNITSFDLNGTTTNGSTFTMPDTDVKITNIVYENLGYTITNNDSDIEVVSAAKTGTVVELKSVDSKKDVTSFKLNNDIVNGNTFTMPSSNVTITNVELSDNGYNITNNNSKVYAPSYGKTGETIHLVVDDNKDGEQVLSFNLNGVATDGNTFTMPSEDVTISNIKTGIVIESLHNYSASYVERERIFYENTFAGASSVRVNVTYQIYCSQYSSGFVKIYDTQTNVYKRYSKSSNQVTDSITISGNYVKITVSGLCRDEYGVKTVITPIY